jgi:hypothetical protein
MNECQKGLAQFLIPRGNASKLFEVIKEPFDLLPQLIEIFIIVYSGYAIALGRYDRDNGMHDELFSNARAVIPFIHNGMGQRRHGRHLRQHRLKDGTLMTMACRQDNRDAGAFIAAARMDFGRQAAPRAAQSLCSVSAVFFNAPAAC